jgi:hypothetical protein
MPGIVKAGQGVLKLKHINNFVEFVRLCKSLEVVMKI